MTTLSAPSDPLLSWDWAIVHISGSTLVALLCSQRGPGNVLVWDWRKGIPLVVSRQFGFFLVVFRNSLTDL